MKGTKGVVRGQAEMAYRYIAIAADGQQTRGTLQVESEQAAERILWQRELTILDLAHIRQHIDLVKYFPSVLGPKSREVILFSRQLATLIDSGVAISSALDLLQGQVSNKHMARVLSEIENDLRMGTALSDAMAKHSIVFDELYCRMVETGERSGDLGPVLTQLADYKERIQETIAKVRGAMAYPAFVLVLAILVVILLVNVALPPMVGLFEEFGAELPWPTRFLIGITQFSADYGVGFLIGSALLSVGLYMYSRRPSGRRVIHRLILRVPWIGKINIQGSVARLCRTMSALLRAGLSLPEAILLSKDTLGNEILREALERVREETLLGRGLSGPISKVRYFPRMLSHLARVGEETGTLDVHLATVADFYEQEVDRALKTMTTVLEPALIIVLGVIVGFVAVSIIMPMYDLLGNVPGL